MYGAMSNANEVISNGILVSCPPSIFAISIENNTMTKQPKTPNAIPIIDADLNNFAISFCLFFSFNSAISFEIASGTPATDNVRAIIYTGKTRRKIPSTSSPAIFCNGI